MGRRMLSLNELLDELGYDGRLSHYFLTDAPPDIGVAHLFRASREAGVQGKSKINGIYVIETRPASKKATVLFYPVVYVAEAINKHEARQLHRKLWNLNYAPFLLVLLPHQIRTYTGFNYSEESEDDGLLDIAKNRTELHKLLTCLTSDAIDSGRVWKSEYGKQLNPDCRVDERLLKNLRELGRVLQDDGLSDEVAHALIGKYVYLSYLRDRNILSDSWLNQQEIAPSNIFTHHASISNLQTLVEALEGQTNGRIFPIDFEHEKTLKDEHVAWVASIFHGDEFKDVPRKVQQLYLPFKAYDFEYIPVETFSAIYEQFIYERKEKGAIYTPEVLADYLLSEVEAIKPLIQEMKILDPACGSGVFLVLAYRRLIEKVLQDSKKEKLHPEKLCNILLGSIYGVEREQDACYITEFSLILTLLHYSEPRELEKLNFKLPDLHNTQVFHCDFFDLDGKESKITLWQKGLTFDWIVGNPPWIRSSKEPRDKFVHAWIQKHASEYPVGNNSVAEAFSWLVTKLLALDGVIGLVLKATSLFNAESRNYRQAFFAQQEVLHITNFSNLRSVLFAGRATFPAVTFVYREINTKRNKSDIIHYSPFSVNQLSGGNKKPWVLTISENEIQAISAVEAEKGDASLWKLALWGTHLDKRAIECIRYMLPMTLKEWCRKKGWHLQEGSQLRHKNSHEKLKHIPDLEKTDYFNTQLMKKSFLRFSIYDNALSKIPPERCYLRKQGGEKGLNVTQAPHIIISPSWQQYITYSERDFVVPPRQIGISAPLKEANYLKALCVYLNSSIAGYSLFFHVQEWGIFRQAKRVTTSEVRKIPIPEFTEGQAEKLAKFHDSLVEIEKEEMLNFVSELLRNDQAGLMFEGTHSIDKIFEHKDLLQLTAAQKKKVKNFVLDLQEQLQQKIDEMIFSFFDFPEDICLLSVDFFRVRLPLDTPSAVQGVTRKPSKQELLAYIRTLRDTLDDFVMGEAHHRVTLTCSNELIECVVKITKEDLPIPVDKDSIMDGDVTTAKLLTELSNNLQKQISQWIYIQRGLRLFDGTEIYIYKTPRLIDWTQTQALVDANDIIGEALSS